MSTQGLASLPSGLRMMSLRDVAAKLAEPNSTRFAKPSGLAPARAPFAPPTALNLSQLDPSRGFKIVEPTDLGAAPPMICSATIGSQTTHGRLDLHGQNLHGRPAPVRARPVTLGPFTVPRKASLGQEVTQGQQKRKMPMRSDDMHMPHREVVDPLRLDKDAASMCGPAKKFHDAEQAKIFADCDSGRSEEMEETGETEETRLRMPWGVEPVLNWTMGSMEQCQPEEFPGLLSHHGSGLTEDSS